MAVSSPFFSMRHVCFLLTSVCVLSVSRQSVSSATPEKPDRREQLPVCRWDLPLRVTAVCELPDGIQSDKSVKGREESTWNRGEKLMNLDAGHSGARWTPWKDPSETKKVVKGEATWWLYLFPYLSFYSFIYLFKNMSYQGVSVRHQWDESRAAH